MILKVSLYLTPQMKKDVAKRGAKPPDKYLLYIHGQQTKALLASPELTATQVELTSSPLLRLIATRSKGMRGSWAPGHSL